MDPILVAAMRAAFAKLRTLKGQGVEITPADMEDFYRQQTHGKYGFADASKAINTDPGLRNMARSVWQGVTMNWGDELLGKIPKALGGGADAENEYRLREELFHQQHPAYDTGGKVAGGLATLLLPGGAEVKGGAAILRGMGLGAAAGAASGAGEGEDAASRLSGGARGAAVGAALGGAIPSVASALRYFRQPSAIAGRKIVSAINNSGGTSALEANLAKLEAGGRGDQAMLADTSPFMRQAADYAANASDDVHVPLTQKLAARQGDATDRVLQDLKGKVGDPHAPTIEAGLDDARKAFASGPEGFGGIRDANPQFNIAPIAQRLSKPGVRESWKLAQLGDNIKAGDPVDALLQKVMSNNPGMTEGEAGEAANAMRSMAANEAARTGKALNPDMAPVPTGRPVSFGDMQTLKQLLDDKVASAYQAGNGNLAEAYKLVRDEVVNGLKEAVPNYSQVLAKYSQHMDAKRALQAGVEAWNNTDSRGLAAQIAALEPDHLALFRQGMASELVKQLRSKATNQNIARELENASPSLEAKLKTVFGDQQVFDDFMQRVGAERDLSRLNSAVGGSQTARREMAQSAPDASEIATTMMHGPAGVASAVLKSAAKASKSATQRAAAASMGPMLMTQGGDAIRAFLRNAGSLAEPTVSSRMSAGLPIAATLGTRSLFDLFNR